MGKIFDKKSIQERQELVQLFSQEANKLIGDIALRNYKKALDLAEKSKGKPEYEKLKKAAEKWESGGINKILLHTVVNGITSGLAGDGKTSGATAGFLNEALQKELAKINDPTLHELASSMIGFVASKIMHKDGKTGAAISASATKNNWLRHEEQEEFAKLLKEAENEEEKSQIVAYYTALSLYNIDKKLIPGLESDEVIEPDLLEQLIKFGLPTNRGLNYTLNNLTIDEFGQYDLAIYYRAQLEISGGSFKYPLDFPWYVKGNHASKSTAGI